MKTVAQLAFRPILLGSILALVQPAFSAGEPQFAVRPVVSNVATDSPDVPATVACGKALVIPLVVNDLEGDAVSYTVTTDQPWLSARVRTGHPVMKMRVRSNNDGSGNPIDGTMEFALFRAETPDTAGFIAGFAQSPYYENVLFHRVISNFVLQGGDPAGTGSGPSPYTLPHEFRPQFVYSGRGQLAMANSAGGYSQTFNSYGRSFQSTNSFGIADGTIEYITAKTTPTNGSQFFITLGQPRHLDFKHTLFGQLLRGFDIMDKVAGVPVGGADKPNANVTMSELSVNPSSSDGILLVSATSVGTGNVIVTARDAGGNTATKTFNIAAVKDATINNDPPIIAPLDPVVTPLGVVPVVKVNSMDLEHDAISTRMPLRVRQTFFNATPPSTETIYASLNAGNLNAVARPTVGAWDVTVGVSGFNDRQLTSSPFDASRFQLLEIGVGDKAIEATPVTLEAKATVATGSVTVASFRHGTLGAASDFIASVNWGDGSALQTSTGATPPVTIVPSISKPGYWDVKGNHTYARAGVYLLQVTIDGPLGSTRVAKGTSVVAADGALFSAIGETHEITGILFRDRPIATIADATPRVKPTDFSASVDWGDGERTADATIRQVGAGRFGVFATHKYTDPETFSVMVKVTRAAFSTNAWSTVKMSGFKSQRYLPPFDKANLTNQWSPSVVVNGQQVSGLPTKKTTGSQTSISGYFFLLNGGSKTAKSPKLKFYLSTDDTLVREGNGADTLLKVGPASSKMTQIPLKSLPPGAGGTLAIANANGVNLAIQLPTNETGAGKYLITDVVYSDPITDNMPVGKTVVFGPLPGILVKLPGTQTSLLVREGAPQSPTTTATFTVALDTLPTPGNVTIPLTVVNNTGAEDESQISVSPAQLVFTPQNAKVPQTVTVTAKNDTIRENDVANFVRLNAATSTDLRFNGMDGTDVAVVISDDDPTGPRGILASKASLSLTEGGSISFTVRPSSAPTQNATLSFDVVDANDVVVTGQVTVPSSITFTAANGTNAQTITISAPNDAVAESTLNLKLRLKPIVSTDTNFSGVDPADIPLTLLDND